MKWAISFPEEEILIVRPSLAAICAGVRPAAKLLSVLLYRYSIRKESKEDSENINEMQASKGEAPTQDTTFRIYRKQEQLVKDMCGEITEKTLHDVAVPTLQILGYLDIDESSPVHCYDLHPDVVIAAMNAYKKGEKQLEKVLNANLQLEKFLINSELENILINKKNFQLALEKVLIANRKSSNNKRGRKPASEKVADTQNQKPQSNRENKESNKKEEDRRTNKTPKENPPPPQKPENQKPSRRTTPEKKTITLSPEAQEVYEEWCKMPWFKTKPELTETLASHLETAKAYKPTADIMLKVKNDATSAKNDRKGFYKGKGWNFKFFLNELPQWLAMHDTSNAQGKAQQSTDGQMNHDQAIQLANTVVAQGKEHGLNIQARATSTSSNAWVVNASWNGNRLPSIASQAFWDKYLVELKLIAEDDAAEQKGAR